MVKKEYEYCLRCGRRLKSERSRGIGYGLVCEGKMRSEKSRRLFGIDGEKETKKEDLH